MSEERHRIVVGDCLDSLKGMAPESVNCCVTSPPYFGLRDYGVDGQIGLEETPAEFIQRLVEVFREVRRVLRSDGTAWVNMGDSYAGSWGAHGRDDMGVGVSTISQRQVMASQRKAKATTHPEYKPKDLMGMPWRLAFALQDDGWYLRQDIIWHKPNPMPESTRDRCTKAHEYIFLLSKSRRYHCDMDAIREQAIYGPTPTGVGFGHGTDAGERDRPRIVVPAGWDTSKGDGGHGAFHKQGSARSARDTFKREGSKREQVIPGQNKGTHRPDRPDSDHDIHTRNKRSVWTVATHGFKGAHFATFPPDLIRPCIQAGCPVDGLVLDPFGGSGTTSVVAMQEGRRSILCELNPEYAEMARKRIDAAWLDGAAQMDILRDQPAA